MSVIDVINSRIQDRGMTLTAISKRSGINNDLLSKSLRSKRRLKAEELVALCQVLDLTLEDFKDPTNHPGISA